MLIYMKYEGILGLEKGKHNGWIRLESLQFGSNADGANPSGPGANKGASPPSAQGIVVTHLQDAISPQLFRESLEGNGKKVTIESVKESGTTYLTVELENTMISSISSKKSGGSDTKTETISLNFAKFSIAYNLWLSGAAATDWRIEDMSAS